MSRLAGPLCMSQEFPIKEYEPENTHQRILKYPLLVYPKEQKSTCKNLNFYKLLKSTKIYHKVPKTIAKVELLLIVYNE